LPYFAARFFDPGGVELDVPPPMSGEAAHVRALATAMLKGPVLADLSDAPPLLKQILRRIQPASFAPFERRGVDLFADRFEIRLFGEGTVRGTGGLRIADEECQTDVQGLYAVGDSATRELIAGATSGGGAQNSAWALTSGRIAGAAAARRAQRDGTRAADKARPVGTAGLRPSASARPVVLFPMLKLIQDQTIAYDKALWRNGFKLAHARDLLDDAWRHLAAHGQADGLEQVAMRETAAMLACARWVTASALAREESRGMHMRTDRPTLDPAQARRLLTGGTDALWTGYEGMPRSAHEGIAA
jgi:succinate dehydrogenase/fumarate reductase flavoprotein subunit